MTEEQADRMVETGLLHLRIERLEALLKERDAQLIKLVLLVESVLRVTEWIFDMWEKEIQHVIAERVRTDGRDAL